MNKANNDWPTPEQIVALRQWREQHGRTWKISLREAWITGDYGCFKGESVYLQQVRNTFGSRWLARFYLHEGGGWSLAHSYMIGLPAGHRLREGREGL